MDIKARREMTIWEAADIVECMLGRGTLSKLPDEAQQRAALEVAFKALRHKADSSYCMRVKNPDGTYHQCIMPFNSCVECPINRYIIEKDISEEELVKQLYALGREDMLTSECRQKYEVQRGESN